MGRKKKSDNEQTEQRAKNKMLVVGLGASAGGLEALKIFFTSLPEKTGMAFIVIVHLSPEHKSSMAELLQDHTSLKVIQVNEKVEIKQDCVYVIPPDKMLSVGDNHLELSGLKKNKHKPVVVDHLFRSLGTVKGENSACIILSGTGSDGCIGLKAVKEHGGLVIAQDPGEAKYDGMPNGAIKTGLVEKILPVGEMAKELMAYKKNMAGDRISDNPYSLPEDQEKVLLKILAQVRSKTDHDFSHYKRSTVLRRIERRMHVNHVDTLADYLSFLKDHPDEAQKVFRDLLITVTNFFRDPEAFKALENKIIPKLFKDKNPDDELRVWVAGCATGEEAYSIAMLLREYAGSLDDSPQIQVFATDVDEDALNQARQGRYPESIAADLTQQRLHRFFDKTGHEYRVKDELRDMILFARHNLLGSPPFSKQDLISCRNLLIYLDKELQGEVFNLFHYALKPEALLFLGSSDSNLEAMELFTPLDKKHRIYRQISRTQSKVHLPDFPLKFDKNQFSASHSWKMPSKTKTNFDKLHRMLITRQYGPPSVIINENDDVLHAAGDINQYLKYTRGEPSRNILEMVIPKLRRPLRSMLYRAKKDGNDLPVRKQLSIILNDERQLIELNVHKIKEKDFPKDLRYIVFRKMDDAKVKSSVGIDAARKKVASDGEAEIIEELENELKHTKEQLQITAEDYETSNEELRTSNEELQSINEELQSTTEELETSQEELQSVNEELKTVNQELESKIDNLSEANNDLKNLMDATEIGIIFMDRESRVKRFTTKATEFFNLIPSDVGRPLEHFTHRFDYDGILDDIKTVRDSSKKIKKEVSDENGQSYDMRLTPYQTTENGIEGVVITFVDVTELKAAEAGLVQQLKQQEILVNMGLYALEQKNLQSVTDRAVEYTCKLLKTEYALLLTLNEEKSTLRESAHTGWKGEKAEKVEVKADKKTDAGFTLRQDGPVIITDFDKEKRFDKLPLPVDDIASGINVVVKGTEDVYGVLCVYSRNKRNFAEQEVNFIKVIANLLGVTTERYYTQGKLKTSNEQIAEKIEKVKDLQRQILKNDVNERWKIGQYLHDELAQSLLAAELMLNHLSGNLKKQKKSFSKETDQLKAILKESVHSARDLSHEIVPIDIEQQGLAQAFNKLANQIERIYGIHCELEDHGVMTGIDNIEIATNLYRITHEAVKNAAIHGDAKNVKITLWSDEKFIYLNIEDDGTGFSDSAKEDGGMGINIMRHRMDLLGGTFDIKKSSDPDYNGVRISCKVPLGT